MCRVCMCRVCTGRVCYVPSLVWAKFVMCRVDPIPYLHDGRADKRAEIHKYYEECDWSEKWAEGLQKILT